MKFLISEFLFKISEGTSEFHVFLVSTSICNLHSVHNSAIPLLLQSSQQFAVERTLHVVVWHQREIFLEFGKKEKLIVLEINNLKYSYAKKKFLIDST